MDKDPVRIDGPAACFDQDGIDDFSPHTATHDELTGLPNRLAFNQALETAAQQLGNRAVLMPSATSTLTISRLLMMEPGMVPVMRFLFGSPG